MPPPKRGLGRGLGALIPTGPPVSAAGHGGQPQPGGLRADNGALHAGLVGAYLEELPVDSIAPNPRQPRQAFDEESLAELAAVAGFSVPHFKPLFRRAVGLPVHRYVVECRVERARQLLLRGDRLLSDIATETGFSHQTHMARCLRRVLGIGPAEVVRLGRRVAVTATAA